MKLALGLVGCIENECGVVDVPPDPDPGRVAAGAAASATGRLLLKVRSPLARVGGVEGVEVVWGVGGVGGVFREVAISDLLMFRLRIVRSIRSGIANRMDARRLGCGAVA